jgi:predicted MFS family arabinose efflux permease
MPPLRISRRCRHVMMAIGLIVIIGAIVMARIADHATPWLVVGFLALVVLVAVALKKEVT